MGTELRHTEMITWFLDSGVRLGDIHDKCLELAMAAQNPDTVIMLQERSARRGDEL